MLQAQGDTGVFLQYTHARLCRSEISSIDTFSFWILYPLIYSVIYFGNWEITHFRCMSDILNSKRSTGYLSCDSHIILLLQFKADKQRCRGSCLWPISSIWADVYCHPTAPPSASTFWTSVHLSMSIFVLRLQNCPFFICSYDEVLYQSAQDLQPKHLVNFLLKLW